MCCHHSSVYITALYTTAHRPNPTCEAISPGFANIYEMRFANIYEKCVDLIEWHIFWKNHIKQDVWPLNSCAIAYVVSHQNFEEPWSIWLGWTVADASTSMSVLNCRINRLHFADETVLHAWVFSTGSSACIWSVFCCVQPSRNENSTKKIEEILCLAQRSISWKMPKGVFPASERKKHCSRWRRSSTLEWYSRVTEVRTNRLMHGLVKQT